MRHIRARLTILAMLLCSQLLISGEAASQLTPAQIKAAYLYNFTKFTRWPASQPNHNPQPVICTYGVSQTNKAISALSGKPLGQQVISLLQPASEAEFQRCNVLYIDKKYHRKLDYMLDLVDTHAVLTISDDTDFIQHGGLIQFQELAGRLRFRINTQLLNQSQIKLSSKLLKVALPDERGKH